MKYERVALPGIFVQSINRILGCPFNILIQPDKDYPPKKGEDEKYYVRITTKTIALRNHCETILKALDLSVCRFVSDEITLHCVIYASDIKRINEALPVSVKSCASNLEKYLRKLFTEIKFSSTVSDTTVDYIATVDNKNSMAFLQVLVNLGIEDWEMVDNDKAVAFTLAKI